MTIEYAFVDDGDKAIYVFRHANISDVSLVIEYAQEFSERQKKMVSHLRSNWLPSYSAGMARVSDTWRRKRKYHTTSSQCPTFQMPADPESIIENSMVDIILNENKDHVSVSEDASDHITRFFDAALIADTKEERGSIRNFEGVNKPFSDYLRNMREHKTKQLQIETMQLQSEQLERVTLAVTDWGTW